MVMTLKIIALPRLKDEANDRYRLRAARSATAEVKSMGRWGEFWATYLLRWSDHLGRGHTPNSPGVQVYKVNTASWLQQCRRQFVSATRGIFGGATGTRLQALAPKARWEESEQSAIDFLIAAGRPKDKLWMNMCTNEPRASC